MISLAGRPAEEWRQGQTFDLGEGVAVDVLNPRGDSDEGHAPDRALVLLFRTGRMSLLWAGKIGPATQEELMRAYPGLHADVLVMDAASPPSADRLRLLHVRDWLQIPPRDRQLNATAPPETPEGCENWPLADTGAVLLRFQVQRGNNCGQIFFATVAGSAASGIRGLFTRFRPSRVASITIMMESLTLMASQIVCGAGETLRNKWMPF